MEVDVGSPNEISAKYGVPSHRRDVTYVDGHGFIALTVWGDCF